MDRQLHRDRLLHTQVIQDTAQDHTCILKSESTVSQLIRLIIYFNLYIYIIIILPSLSTPLLPPPISFISSLYFLFFFHVMCLSVGIALLFYISMFFGSDWLVYLLAGEHIEEASVIMRLLGISAILTSINGFFGGNRLVPLGYSFVYMRVMVGNCLFFLTAIGLLWLTESITMYTVTVMVVGVEVFCFVSLVYRKWQLGLLAVNS